MRFPTDVKLLWECTVRAYKMMCGISSQLGEHRLRTKYNDIEKANLAYRKQRRHERSEERNQERTGQSESHSHGGFIWHSSIMISIISAFDMVELRRYCRFLSAFSVYFSIMASKYLQKSSAIQNNSVTLSSVIIAIIVCNSLYFNTIKLQHFSLTTKFLSTYISSNSR